MVCHREMCPSELLERSPDSRRFGEPINRAMVFGVFVSAVAKDSAEIERSSLAALSVSSRSNQFLLPVNGKRCLVVYDIRYDVQLCLQTDK